MFSKTRADISGADWLRGVGSTTTSPDVPHVLGGLLGFGSFSSVYANDGKDEEGVIKLSRYEAKSQLLKEAQVLNQLEDVSGISQLVKKDVQNFIFKIGGVEAGLPALYLKPKGLSVCTHLAKFTEPKEEDAEIMKIANEAVKVLENVHKKKVTHNDPSPKNLLIDESGKLLLVDFGLATMLTEVVKGFRGTASFTHSSIFDRYPNNKWRDQMPREQFDMTSLAYSMAVISNGGKQLWKSFQPCDFTTKGGELRKADFKSWVSKRSTRAWSQLQKVGFPEQPWKAWCEDGNEGTNQAEAAASTAIA